MGVAVGVGGRALYAAGGRKPRVPASNQKLLLSMALLDLLGPGHRIPTRVTGAKIDAETMTGDLWVAGGGDPTLTDHDPGYWGDLRATTLARLAVRIKRSGVERIAGRVMGSGDFFGNDLDAPGWQPYVPWRYVQPLSSLALKGNNAGFDHPARAVAAALTKELEKIGVPVAGDAGAGTPPARSSEVATVRSPPLAEILSYTNATSNNFFAEMLGKLLGARALGPPGTIAKGARAIEAWARANGVPAVAHDSSGLSYANRVSASGVVKLLGVAESRPWAEALRAGLPAAGEGTLGSRLSELRVRAKTGTLFNGASALSGWVRSARSGRWIAFSILSRDVAKGVEDRVVRIIARAAIRAPGATRRVSLRCSSRPPEVLR